MRFSSNGMASKSRPASTLRLLTVHGSRYTCSICSSLGSFVYAICSGSPTIVSTGGCRDAYRLIRLNGQEPSFAQSYPNDLQRFFSKNSCCFRRHPKKNISKVVLQFSSSSSALASFKSGVSNPSLNQL